MERCVWSAGAPASRCGRMTASSNATATARRAVRSVKTQPVYRRLLAVGACGHATRDVSLLLLVDDDVLLREILSQERLRAVPDRDPAAVEERLVRVVGHDEQLVRHLVGNGADRPARRSARSSRCDR